MSASSSHPLPRGALSPHVPNLEYSREDLPLPSSGLTPPGTATQLLNSDTEDKHIHYASSSHVEKSKLWNEAAVQSDQGPIHPWTPLPLRPAFWIPLVVFMVALAIGLEIALHFSNKNQGWPTLSAATTDSGFIHFAYTLPPVIVAMFIVALWAWTDIEMKKMQPYIDLVHGDSPPQRSLLLDYTKTNNFVVWISAFWNHHYMVGIATLITLLSLVFQPLGAAMFTVRSTYFANNANVSNLAAISLNQGPAFQDLTSFLSASGYASSSVLYNLGDPQFVYDVYTVAPFQIPTSMTKNGTIFANTTAVKSDANCAQMSTVSTQNANGGWTNAATYNGCTFTYSVNKTTAHLFGTNIMPDCNDDGTPEWFRATVLWFFSYDTSPPIGSATHCAPNISLWDVAITVDIASGNLTSVKELSPFDASTSPFASLSANVTGAPLNGRAYNGVAFNLTTVDPFVTARADATNLQLPASIAQLTEMSSDGFTAAVKSNDFVPMASQVYTTYLKLIAKSVYFLPVAEAPMVVVVKTFKQRLWLSDTAVQILVTVLLLVAVVGTLVQLIHRHQRRDLRLRHEPGTIASAVSFGAQTDLAILLSGYQRDDDFIQALRNKKFRIDPQTMKILMEGEAGYEQAASPHPPQSVFAGLGRVPSTKTFSAFGRGQEAPVSA